MTFLY